ncbi:MAG: NmrA family NAD(P)-binding protein [Anaerolineae bacterium]
MTARILVTGAPGNVGTEVVLGLQEAGVPFRIGAFDVEAARRAFGPQAEIVHFDFLKPETYRPTFEGIAHMFLVRPPQLADVPNEIAPAIWAAVGAGVQHIVFLSLQGVENNRIVPHYKIEKLILQTGVSYTFLRCSFFMQNLSTTHRTEIRDENVIALPVGKAKTSFIDTRDIAAVAVRTLTESGHDHQKYTLTGAEALDYNQVAIKLSSSVGHTVRYTNPSLLRFVRRQLAQGRKLGYTLVMAGLYTITRFGNAKDVTQDVESILGRAPITFDQFAQDYRDVWMASR